MLEGVVWWGPEERPGSSHPGSAVTNLTSIHEDAGSIPDLAHWAGDPALPWAVVWVADEAQILSYPGCGVAPIQPLALEFPYVSGAALKRQEKKKNKRKRLELEWWGGNGKTPLG